ncbi:hypothetical protein LCGC14_1940380, partial [marine sediment metagenome]
ITSTASGQFYPPTVEMPINTDFSTSITIPAGALEYLDNSFATITAGISSTTYPTGFVVPLQGEFTFTKGGWGFYSSANLQTINGQYSTIASASTPVYGNSFEAPLAGDFSGTGDLTYQGDLGTIGTPYTTVGGVSGFNYTGDQRSEPNEWDDWISWIYGSGSANYGTLTSNDGVTNRIDAGVSSTYQGTQSSNGIRYPDGSTPSYDNLYSTPNANNFSGTGILNYQGDLGTIGSPYTTIDGVYNPIITGDQRAGPHEWNDWTWIEGSGSTDYGTLTINDGDTNRIDATLYPSTEYWSLMFPESDLYNGDPTPPFSSFAWQSSPIASKLGPGPNGEITAGGPVTPSFCVVTLGNSANIPSGSYVTKIEVAAGGYYSGAIDSAVTVGFNGGPSGGKDITFTSTTQYTNTVTWDNLWASQYDDADMNGMTLWLRSDNGFQFGPLQHINWVGVRVYYKAPDEYKHEYLIKWDVNDGSMSSIQNLRYEWKQSAAENTKMYTTADGSNYNILISDLATGTSYITGAYAISPYVRNGDEVWLKIVSDGGAYNEVSFDQLYIEYTTSTPNYDISKEVYWIFSGTRPIAVDMLTYAHSGTSVTFEVHDGVGWDPIGASPFTLQPEHVIGGDAVRVRYSKSSSSDFTLNIDQLRFDYRDGWGLGGIAVDFDTAVATASDNKFIQSFTDVGNGGDIIDFSLTDWATIPANYYISEIRITTTARYSGSNPTLLVSYQIEGGWSSEKSQSMSNGVFTTNTLSWTGLWNNPGYDDADADGINIRFKTTDAVGSDYGVD